MIATGTKVKLVAFVVIALLVTTYLSVRYVGLNLFESGYRVTVSLPNAGGSFVNGEVTYRGVPVGRIEDLTPTRDGMEAVLRIDTDAPPIPADSEVHVANRSAIGEQYIDLRGSSDAEEMLADGDHLAAGADALPPKIDELLRTGRDFFESVPSKDLTTVIDESYDLSRGAAGHLHRLLETSKDFADAAETNFLVTAGLIENSSTVLDTQQRSARSIRGFSRNLKLLAQTMRKSDKPLRSLIGSVPSAALEMGKLFVKVGQPLGVLMSNLISPAQVFGINAVPVADAMSRLPEAISIGYAIDTPAGLDLGLALSFFDPLPCVTGYEATQRRTGLDTDEGQPFNLDAGCTADPATGSDVRGPRSVPAQVPAAKIGTPRTLAELLGG